jgi:hypothetical protein
MPSQKKWECPGMILIESKAVSDIPSGTASTKGILIFLKSFYVNEPLK